MFEIMMELVNDVRNYDGTCSGTTIYKIPFEESDVVVDLDTLFEGITNSDVECNPFEIKPQAYILCGRLLIDGKEHQIKLISMNSPITILKNKFMNKKGKFKEIKEKIGKVPGLAIVLVGENPASKIYVNSKIKGCAELGFESFAHYLPENVTEEELLNVIRELNADEKVDGILVQLPLPKHIDEKKVVETIAFSKDVDGFNPINVGKLAIGEKSFISCTPYGVVKMLEEYNINPEGKNVVIIGRSNIVGKPLLQCLLNKNATITICHSKTRDIKAITKNADILIAAVGRPHFVTEDMVKDGAVVIDVGINRNEEGKLIGDVDFENVEKKASYITPVPGGVGPMTIAMLMNNVVEAAKMQNGI